jgi:acyl-CoA thioester hydrolase
MKIIETPVQKRFADIDVFGHVNNNCQQAYLDLGKTDYCAEVLGINTFTDSLALMVVSVKTDFVAQVRYEQPAFVKTWVERVGTKSITLRQQIITRTATGPCSDGSCTAGETICTESETVLVAFDRTAQQTFEIPVMWRERING